MRLPNTINQNTAKTPVNSAASITVKADPFPSAKLFIGKTRADGFYAGISGLYSPDGNEWCFYAPPYFFPDGGKTFYKVVATDEHGNRVVVSSGRLFVVYEDGVGMDGGGGDGGGDGGEGGDGEKRTDAYVLGEDGWHRLRVSVDDSGRLAFTVEQFPHEGEDYDMKTPYAFNPDTGMFHPLSAFRDDTGIVMVAMGDPDDAGSDSFAMDADTHVWYKIETDGVNIAVGEVA